MSKTDLKPVRTSEEAKIRGRNGGLASGKARREKRTLKELMRIALDSAYADRFGLDSEYRGRTNAEVIAAKLCSRAASGDMAAIKLIFQLEGESARRETVTDDTDAELVDA